MLDYFSDVNYKFTITSNCSSVDDCIKIIGAMPVAWCEKQYEDWTIEDIKEFLNGMVRLNILDLLKKIPSNKWNNLHNDILNYIISDIDFYKSEGQLRVILEQCRNLC